MSDKPEVYQYLSACHDDDWVILECYSRPIFDQGGRVKNAIKFAVVGTRATELLANEYANILNRLNNLPLHTPELIRQYVACVQSAGWRTSDWRVLACRTMPVLGPSGLVSQSHLRRYSVHRSDLTRSQAISVANTLNSRDGLPLQPLKP